MSVPLHVVANPLTLATPTQASLVHNEDFLRFLSVRRYHPTLQNEISVQGTPRIHHPLQQRHFVCRNEVVVIIRDFLSSTRHLVVACLMRSMRTWLSCCCRRVITIIVGKGKCRDRTKERKRQQKKYYSMEISLGHTYSILTIILKVGTIAVHIHHVATQ
jgi:hypothetical protein